MLKEIQNIENLLINSVNCGSSSKLFTEMMHKTSEWIDRDFKHEEQYISPYKLELDKTIDNVAYYIECGETTENAFKLVGKDIKAIKPKLTDTHRNILWAARKQRIVNKLKNESLKNRIKYKQLNNK